MSRHANDPEFALICVLRIAYVRFDGQMSAKRREDTIARFSVPITEDPTSAPQSVAIDGTQRRTRTKTINSAALDDDDDMTNGDDSDFVVGDDGDDSDFVGDDRDEGPKRKAKSKSKGKGKAKAAPRKPYNGSMFDDVNPRVMLISLKAGALGLNLTVANNVYL